MNNNVVFCQNCMKKINMPIKKIKEYVDLSKQGDVTLNQRYSLILEQKEVIKKFLQQWKSIKFQKIIRKKASSRRKYINE